jgi:HlyD family secretion protein
MTRRTLDTPTRLRYGISISAIVILLLWVLGAFRRGVIHAGKQPVPEASAAGLATQQVTLRTTAAVTELVGTVQAEQLASLSSRVAANIVDLRVAAGQRVASGTPLVVLDDRELRHRLEQAQGARAGAEATLAQARSDYQRDKLVFDQQGISAYDFEHTQTSLKLAEAGLHRLQQAEKEAEVDLSFAVIRSPFAGVVVDKLVNLGDQATPGKPLVTVYQDGRFWLEVNVPEDLMGHIHLHDLIPFRIDALGAELRGQVVEIVPSSDPASRTVVARVRLPRTREVLPGMFGRLLLPTRPEARLMVSAQALVRAGQLTLVDVVRDGQVERRAVQLGQAAGDQFEVLSGLSAGETVVVRNAQ